MNRAHVLRTARPKEKVGQGFPCAITISAPYVMSALTTVGSRKKMKRGKEKRRYASIVIQCYDDFRDGWWKVIERVSTDR